jgi:hypothetical protein
MRSRVVGVLLAVAVLMTASSYARAADSGSAPAGRPAILDVTGWHYTTAGTPLPSAADGIGPGSYLLITTTDVSSGSPAQFICTANFVWDGTGGPYLGAAGHCFLPENKDAYVGKDPYVTKVEVCVSGCLFGGQLGAGFAGTFKTLGAVVYARQLRGDLDIGNDFGLVRIPSGLTKLIRPSVPVWGGPAGSAVIGTGTPVCLYGNGDGVGEVFATKARTGVGVIQGDGDLGEKGAWFADVPSAPGDSGSAVVNCAPSASGLSGTTAVGILTHLVVGDPGVVAGTTVAQAIAMVKKDLGKSITLRNG